MEQNYFQKMSGAIAAAESLRYIGLSLDEVGKLCDVSAPLLEAAIHSVNPDILAERENIRRLLKIAEAQEASRPASSETPDRNLTPVQNFAIELKEGVRPSSFRKYASSINAYATSTASLQKICRANHVPSGSCHEFMRRYYPEAAKRHNDILEGRFAVTSGDV